jgi:hypothetical protein
LRLGVIPLKKGRGKLTLRALDVAGKQVADIRYVALLRGAGEGDGSRDPK